jgi:hypothetical protein
MLFFRSQDGNSFFETLVSLPTSPRVVETHNIDISARVFPWDKQSTKLKVTVKWLALLLSIRAVPGSNLSMETGDPEVPVVFPSPCR